MQPVAQNSTTNTHRIQSMCLIKLIINYFQVIEGVISVESFKNTPKIRKGEKNQQMALPRLEPGPLGLPASKSKQLTTTLTRLSMNYAPQKSIIQLHYQLLVHACAIDNFDQFSSICAGHRAFCCLWFEKLSIFHLMITGNFGCKVDQEYHDSLEGTLDQDSLNRVYSE